MQLAFLLLVALATTMTVPVVGTLLVFALMIGAPATARSFTDHPLHAMALSVAVALAIVWAAIALSYTTDYPVGFFVGTIAPPPTQAGGSGRPGGGGSARRARASARPARPSIPPD